MITRANLFDLAIRLAHLLDWKKHRVNIDRIKKMLVDEEMDIIDYLEHDYGHVADFSFLDKETRAQITRIFQDRVLAVDMERKWGIKNDGISMLLACTIELLSNIDDRHYIYPVDHIPKFSN